MEINFTNLFISNLPSDSILENFVRSVENACYSFVNPTPCSKPTLIHWSNETADLLNINNLSRPSKESLFSGNYIHPSSKPYAMNYAGHQFGYWAGQLGDGRAINLGEINNYALQLKGAGKTPYSRKGDGLAVLRSSIREYICSEAMYYLNIPTTRSLCLIKSGDNVLRDILYDGNAAYEKGAIVTRVAPSFIRFGNFELLAAQNDIKNLKKLADFTILNYFPQIEINSSTKYNLFFNEVCLLTKKMIIDWLRVGFVHGVMNTDNMSILGLTIDYGPYGWLDEYNTNWTPNTTDTQNKRYCFGNQSDIAIWNLIQLANALYPLINKTNDLEKSIQNFVTDFQIEYEQMMSAKLGINNQSHIKPLIIELLQLFENIPIDMTIFFRQLGYIKKTATIDEAFLQIKNALYTNEENTNIQNWLSKYITIINVENLDDTSRKDEMNKINPKYIFRNYIAQMVIEKANEGDYSLLNEVFEMIKKPYDEQPYFEKWYTKKPDWANNKVGCSMLSCSS